jgi:hypothetical protein
MYNPTTGRWLSRDPIGFNGGDANLYRYVANMPTMRTDPSGQSATCQCGTRKARALQPQAKCHDCCVEGKVVLNSDAKLQGGWSIEDYYVHLTLRKRKVTIAGPVSHQYCVQLYVGYTGKQNCGITQQITIKKANEAFLDSWRNQLERKDKTPPANVKIGYKFWDYGLVPEQKHGPHVMAPGQEVELRYADGFVSFGDCPGITGRGAYEGALGFETCFYSKGKNCKYKKCCLKWNHTFDFTKPREAFNESTVKAIGKSTCE